MHENTSMFVDGFFDDLRARCDTLAFEAERALEETLGAPRPIDEVAIQVLSLAHENALLREAVRHGWVMFNSAEDHVRTSPIPAEYTVGYNFLRHPDVNYRLEVMRLGNGLSPLHAGVMNLCQCCGSHEVGGIFIVHASFKCNDEADYDATCDALMIGGLLPAQACQSTYGRFSYWRKGPQFEDWQWGDSLAINSFLKPRVNTRDAS